MNPFLGDDDSDSNPVHNPQDQIDAQRLGPSDQRSSSPLADIESALERFRPSAPTTSMSDTFYRAGFEAAAAERMKMTGQPPLAWRSFIGGTISGIAASLLILALLFQMNVPSNPSISNAKMHETVSSSDLGKNVPSVEGNASTPTLALDSSSKSDSSSSQNPQTIALTRSQWDSSDIVNIEPMLSRIALHQWKRSLIAADVSQAAGSEDVPPSDPFERGANALKLRQQMIQENNDRIF